MTVFLVPGAFGFLMWELKENWRLYAANRQTNLEPIVVGEHGENVVQLLRPGFRSGTIPKLYAKLRRAGRKSFWTGRWGGVRKYREHLHEAEEHLRRLVDRELLAILRQSPLWPFDEIATGEIHLGSNRISIELYCPDLSTHGMWLELEESGGVLVAGITQRGWFDQLTPATRQTLLDALAGFYKISGVSLVREQLEERLPLGSLSYEVVEQGVLVRPRDGRGAARLYPLQQGSDTAHVDVSSGEPIVVMPAADCRAMIFAWNPISWQRWVAMWQTN